MKKSGSNTIEVILQTRPPISEQKKSGSNVSQLILIDYFQRKNEKAKPI